MSETISGDFLEFESGIVSPALRAIVQYWQKIRGDRLMPGWSDLSPNQLGPHLKLLWFFNFDRHAGEFTARLGSNRAMVGFRQSFRGTPLRDLHPPHIFELCQAHMIKVVSDPAAYRCSGKLFKAGSQIVEGERIMLPLGSDYSHGDGVLGATDFPMRPGTGPVELLVGDIRWFSI